MCAGAVQRVQSRSEKKSHISFPNSQANPGTDAQEVQESLQEMLRGLCDETKNDENLRNVEGFRAHMMASASDPMPPPPTNRNTAAGSEVDPAPTSEASSPTKASGAKTRRGGAKGGKGKKGGAADDAETYPCFHCETEGAKMCCSQCHSAWYVWQ